MKTLGIFEVKTKLSEICEQVAKTGQAVTVTRRGKPLVRIDPIEQEAATILERRATYMTRHGGDEEADSEDFAPPARSDERFDFELED